MGKQARELYDDARRLLDQIVSKKQLTARAVYGFFPANSVGDDLELYADEERASVLTTFHSLRQQAAKPAGQTTTRWRTTLLPKAADGRTTWGGSRSPAGHGTDELVARFQSGAR